MFIYLSPSFHLDGAVSGLILWENKPRVLNAKEDEEPKRMDGREKNDSEEIIMAPSKTMKIASFRMILLPHPDAISGMLSSWLSQHH